MKFIQRIFYGSCNYTLTILFISLIAIFGTVGCEKKKKTPAVWPLALLGGLGNSEQVGGAQSDLTVTSSSKDITNFSISHSSLGTYSGIIDGNEIIVRICVRCNLNSLKANFVHNGEIVSIENVEQVSGTSLNDFISSKIYTVKAKDGSTKNYNVSVINTINFQSGTCYDDTTTTACGNANFPKQEGDLPQNLPQFTKTTLTNYPNDYVTIDNGSGLIWKTCSEGYTGTNCDVTSGIPNGYAWTTGVHSGYSYLAASVPCNNLNNNNSGAGFAGRKNWRLPTIQELSTLYDPRYFPNIDKTKFPSYQAQSFWSSTELVNPNSFVWILSILGQGIVNACKPNGMNCNGSPIASSVQCVSP